MKIRRLGYPCINNELNTLKERVTTNRTIRQATLEKTGSSKLSELYIQNLKDLKKIIAWNNNNGIKLFRLSSGIFPWKSKFTWEKLLSLTHYDLISDVGHMAKEYDQRLTFHPGPFNKLCSTDSRVLDNTMTDLKIHGDIMNLMGLRITHENPINIHLGAAYGDKRATAKNWVKNYSRLGSHVKPRLTIENDDKKALYTTEELYYLVYQQCGVPIMFDFHHEALNPSKNWGLMKAARMAASTWPDNIVPVFHWSESRREEQSDSSIAINAHSDYTYGPLPNIVLDRPIDLMIEAKAKEENINLLTYYNGEKVHVRD